jgi:hypothetical protein
LGKISPKEFAQFIGKGMRLNKVEYAPKPGAVPILNFQSLIQYYEQCCGVEFWLWPRRHGRSIPASGL